MARYHGKSGVIYISTTGTGATSSILNVKSWTFDRSVDTVDVTSFGDSNKTYVQGLPDAKGTFEAHWDDTSNPLFTGAASADGVKIYLYPSSNAVSKYIYGPVWLSASINTGVAAAVMTNGSFVAAGSMGINL